MYENYVTPVKLQNPFGTCWGFGAIAAAEISLLGSGLAQADGYGAAADPEKGIKELNLYPGTHKTVSARFFGAADAVTDPNQGIQWTCEDPAVITTEPFADPNNDGKIILNAAGLGETTLTADAGPYGKDSLTMTVAKRSLVTAVLDNTQPVYTGQPIEPKVLRVMVSQLPSEELPPAREGKDFRVEYTDNVKCGAAQVRLIGMGDYADFELVEDFTIVPARAEITGATRQGDSIAVRFASQADSGIDGYILSWRPVGTGDGAVQTMDLPADADSAEITGLEPGEIYTFSLGPAPSSGRTPTARNDHGRMASGACESPPNAV